MDKKKRFLNTCGMILQIFGWFYLVVIAGTLAAAIFGLLISDLETWVLILRFAVLFLVSGGAIALGGWLRRKAKALTVPAPKPEPRTAPAVEEQTAAVTPEKPAAPAKAPTPPAASDGTISLGTKSWGGKAEHGHTNAFLSKTAEGWHLLLDIHEFNDYATPSVETASTWETKLPAGTTALELSQIIQEKAFVTFPPEELEKKLPGLAKAPQEPKPEPVWRPDGVQPPLTLVRLAGSDARDLAAAEYILNGKHYYCQINTIFHRYGSTGKETIISYILRRISKSDFEAQCRNPAFRPKSLGTLGVLPGDVAQKDGDQAIIRAWKDNLTFQWKSTGHVPNLKWEQAPTWGAAAPAEFSRGGGEGIGPGKISQMSQESEFFIQICPAHTGRPLEWGQSEYYSLDTRNGQPYYILEQYDGRVVAQSWYQEKARVDWGEINAQLEGQEEELRRRLWGIDHTNWKQKLFPTEEDAHHIHIGWGYGNLERQASIVWFEGQQALSVSAGRSGKARATVLTEQAIWDYDALHKEIKGQVSSDYVIRRLWQYLATHRQEPGRRLMRAEKCPGNFGYDQAVKYTLEPDNTPYFCYFRGDHYQTPGPLEVDGYHVSQISQAEYQALKKDKNHPVQPGRYLGLLRSLAGDTENAILAKALTEDRCFVLECAGNIDGVYKRISVTWSPRGMTIPKELKKDGTVEEKALLELIRQQTARAREERREGLKQALLDAAEPLFDNPHAAPFLRRDRESFRSYLLKLADYEISEGDFLLADLHGIYTWASMERGQGNAVIQERDKGEFIRKFLALHLFGDVCFLIGGHYCGVEFRDGVCLCRDYCTGLTARGENRKEAMAKMQKLLEETAKE